MITVDKGDETGFEKRTNLGLVKMLTSGKYSTLLFRTMVILQAEVIIPFKTRLLMKIKKVLLNGHPKVPETPRGQ